MASLSPEQELHCQTAFILASAVDAFDPVLALKDKLQLHNFTEYFVYDGGVTKAMLALSSNAIKVAAKTNAGSQPQVTPTVFIAFSNSLRHPAHDVPGQASIANFLTTQRQCGFPGASACRVQGHALAALESIPLGVVFSLLGQGYKLVTTGFKFGGVVAHLFATRVLLQLQQEVQLARQMGINLTMSLADNKVSSYAFGSPFFATSSLSRAFASMDLQTNQHVNLHTLWRAGDGSPAFFAAASEMYTVAAAARDAAADSAAGGGGGADAAPVAVDGDDGGASLARTPQLLAVQEWCRYAADGVDTLLRCRASGPSRLMARPLENQLLTRVAAPGGLLAVGVGAPGFPIDCTSSDVAAMITAAAIVAEKLRVADGTDGGGSASPKSPASRSSSITAGPSRTSSITSRTPSMTAGSRPGLSQRRSQGALDQIAARPASPARALTAAGAAGPASPARAAAAGRPASPARAAAAAGGAARRSSLVVSDGPKPAAVRTAAGASRAGAKANAWRDGLLRLLQVMGDGLGERYAPVGQFWVLGSVPTERDAKARSPAGAAAGPGATTAGGGGGGGGTALQAIEGTKAMQSSAAWLSLGNAAGIFSRWESELDEIERELMDAMAWVTFATKVEVRGTVVDRRELLRQSAALDLAAA